MATATVTPSPTRDRYAEANQDLFAHVGDKIMASLKTSENQARIQSVLDPIVSHIISRVFPYILLSAILFLILLMLTVGTFWMVMRTSPFTASQLAALASINTIATAAGVSV
jgi:hypothetical protein